MWAHDTFKELVEDNTDFTGMIAYSLYKNEKVAWIESHKAKHGTYPTQDELKEYFYPSISNQLTVKRYKEQAENLTNNFLINSISEQVQEYQQEVRDEEILKKLKTHWFKKLLEGVAIAILSAAIVSVGANMYWLNHRIQESKDREAILQELNLPKNIQNLIANPPSNSK